MAEAIISGLIRQNLVNPAQLVITGPRQERLDELSAKYGVTNATANTHLIQKASVIILAVKPQKLNAVMREIGAEIPESTLVLSIVAGAPLKTLQGCLQHEVIVRSMPNTPAQIGEGITVWTATKDTPPAQIEQARSILGALGDEIFVEDESYIDMATAVSGTGPAYVLIFLEALIDSGVHLGLPRRIAEQMVVQTIKGTIDFYASKDDHPATLRNQVTSPGGTTASALYYLEKMGFRTAVSRAIWAAYSRSQELGKGKHQQNPDEL